MAGQTEPLLFHWLRKGETEEDVVSSHETTPETHFATLLQCLPDMRRADVSAAQAACEALWPYLDVDQQLELTDAYLMGTTAIAARNQRLQAAVIAEAERQKQLAAQRAAERQVA